MWTRTGRVTAAAIAILWQAGCGPETSATVSPPPGVRPQPPRRRSGAAVEQVRDWTGPHRATPPVRHRNPFTFGAGVPRRAQDAPLPPGVSPESLPELPLPIPASDLHLIGIAGAEPGGQPTAIVTVGNDLVLAKPGDTIAARYRVVRVGEDSLDVIDAVGNQPRHLSLR
jgi:hypothetical protein